MRNLGLSAEPVQYLRMEESKHELLSLPQPKGEFGLIREAGRNSFTPAARKSQSTDEVRGESLDSRPGKRIFQYNLARVKSTASG